MARPEPVGTAAMAGCRAIMATVAVLLLAFFLLSPLWGQEILAGVPGVSARAIASAVVADLQSGREGQIAPMLQDWGHANSSALGVVLTDDTNRVLEAYPLELRGTTWDPTQDPVEQLARARGLNVATDDYAAQQRSFTGPDGVRVYHVIAVVPDVGVLSWWKAPFAMLMLANAILVVGYWVLVATWVYVDALLRKPRRVALRWSLFALGFNLIALAVYLAVGRRESLDGD